MSDLSDAAAMYAKQCAKQREELDRLRAANARLQAWHDAVRSDPWWYDEHGNEIMFRPQPLAKE